MAANDPGDPGVISEGGSAAPDGVAVPDEAALPATRWWKRRIVKIGLWAVIAVFAWFALSRLIGAVDWLAVGSAFGRLQPWAMVLLLVALLVRQALNAVPLIYYVPGLRWGQSMRNDLAANVMATFAPPSSDIVLRVTMFRSWGLDPVMGIAGSTLNSFKFYAVPLFGLGVMDALLVGAWTTIAGVVHEPSIVAATIIWRVVTILGTLLLGLLVLGHWKIGHAVEAAQVEEAQGEGAQGAGS